MKITVVTSTLNRVGFIDKCLSSVESQTYRNIEHIFVDGYSTDGTVEKVRAYIKRNKDIECKFIQSEPKGVSNAMNIGIKNATGDIIHFLHSDDYYVNKTSLERVNNEFEKDKNLKWLIGSVGLEFKGKQLIIGYKTLLELGLKNMVGISLIPHDNTFVRRSLFRKYGKFKEERKITMDYDYWNKLLRTENPKITKDCYAIFIIHKGSISSNPTSLIPMLKEKLEAWKDYKVMPLVGYIEDNEIYKTYKDIKNFLDEIISSLK